MSKNRPIGGFIEKDKITIWKFLTNRSKLAQNLKFFEFFSTGSTAIYDICKNHIHTKSDLIAMPDYFCNQTYLNLKTKFNIVFYKVDNCLECINVNSELNNKNIKIIIVPNYFGLKILDLNPHIPSHIIKILDLSHSFYEIYKFNKYNNYDYLVFNLRKFFFST